jgi:hypothetical protein
MRDVAFSLGKRFDECRWVGKTRVLVSENNGFSAQFPFMALANGISQMPGETYINSGNGLEFHSWNNGHVGWWF